MYRKRKISNIKTTNNKQGGKEMKRKISERVIECFISCSNGNGLQATVMGTRNLVRRKLNRRQTKREVTSLGILVWTERTHSL